MASFDSINYSLRPSKHIERALAFDAIKKIRLEIDCSSQIYIGFGSVWFIDFQLAHKALGIRNMWSIEANEIGYARALFNRPYRTIAITNSSSSEAIAKFIKDERINTVPWLVWLDYDSALSEMIVEDMRALVENAPINSILLATFSATLAAYGKPNQRAERIRSLLGAVVPDGFNKEQCTEETLAESLAGLTQDFLTSIAANASRPGGYMPAFKMIYSDSAPMITVGGVLPALGAAPAMRQLLTSKTWPGFPVGRIVAPPLTLREATVLQSQLPRDRRLTRSAIKKLGFDLKEEQIQTYEKYYLHYPNFAQIAT